MTCLSPFRIRKEKNGDTYIVFTRKYSAALRATPAASIKIHSEKQNY